MSFWEAFFSRVDKSGDCWLWLGATDRKGYGKVSRKPPKGFSKFAHRVAYQLIHGSVLPGLCVCHKCDTRRCVRPSHLFVGTIADNNRDMTRKGRHRTKYVNGEGNPAAKLTRADVVEIRRLYAEGVKQGEIAKNFSVTNCMVSHIVTYRNWVWLS